MLCFSRFSGWISIKKSITIVNASYLCLLVCPFLIWGKPRRVSFIDLSNKPNNRLHFPRLHFLGLCFALFPFYEGHLFGLSFHFQPPARKAYYLSLAKLIDLSNNVIWSIAKAYPSLPPISALSFSKLGTLHMVKSYSMMLFNWQKTFNWFLTCFFNWYCDGKLIVVN